MSTDRFYPIGTPGVPWSDDERHQWSSTRSVERSYREEVLAPLEGLRETHRVETYGALSVDPERYPLFCAHPSRVVEGAPWVLVTGGVHGYETSIGCSGNAMSCEASVVLHPIGTQLFLCLHP